MQIWEDSFGYRLGRLYVDSCTRGCFRRYRVRGRENIPADGAVIYAPNHCNTLMDALVVLRDYKGPITFGARYDIFQKSPVISSILRWLKIVPLARSRDGVDTVSFNQNIFEEVVVSLSHGAPFCIFPEGTHRTKRSLQPLKKGVFRVALQAARTLSGPVYIVPVGLDYESYFRSGMDFTISYGEPMNISEYVAAHTDVGDSASLKPLADELFRRMSSLITYFPDDENYDAAFAAWQREHRPSVWRKIISILLFPLTLVTGVLALPVWLPAGLIVRKLRDKAWSNTARFGFKLVLLPLMMLIAAILGFIFLPWWGAVALIIAVALSPRLFYLLTASLH